MRDLIYKKFCFMLLWLSLSTNFGFQLLLTFLVCISCYILCVFHRGPCRYHPTCLEMSIDQAKKLDHFVCAECSEYDTKKSQEAVSASPLTNVKVRVLIDCFHLFKVACVLSLWPFAAWCSVIYITSQDIVTDCFLG